MKVERDLFAVIGTFFVIVAIVYGVVTGWGEPVGVACMGLCAGLGYMIAGYLHATGRRLGLRPEDDSDGEIAQQAGEYGVFSPGSWWPLWLALATAMLSLGVAGGWWFFIIGAVVGLVALLGWTFESYTGKHSL